MRCSELWIIKICLVFFCLFLPVNACNAAQAKPQGKETPVSNAPMTQEELQSAVIGYANRFIATVGQAAYGFEKKVPTPEGRLIASARKVYSLSAVIEIAAGPSPGAALLRPRCQGSLRVESLGNSGVAKAAG